MGSKEVTSAAAELSEIRNSAEFFQQEEYVEKSGLQSRLRSGKLGWRFLQVVAVIFFFFLNSTLLNMAFSETTAEIIQAGRAIPAGLEGCSTITYASKLGKPYCSKFGTIETNPKLFVVCLIAAFAVLAFLGTLVAAIEDGDFQIVRVDKLGAWIRNAESLTCHSTRALRAGQLKR